MIRLRVSLVFVLCTMCLSLFGQPYITRFKNSYFELSYYNRYPSMHDFYIAKSLSKNSYDFMQLGTVIDALNAVYLTTQDSSILSKNIDIITNVVNTALKSNQIGGSLYQFKDVYRGWIDRSSRNEETVYKKEVMLYEGYLFRYIVQTLYILKESGWAAESDANMQWYNRTLNFIEQNVWEKWASRSSLRYGNKYAMFFRNRTHMASHWATISLLLEKLSVNPSKKVDYRTVYRTFDIGLRNNLKINKVSSKGIMWNATWDHDIGSASLKKAHVSIVQDVSHGNHVVSYIVTAFEIGNSYWRREDIDNFCNTVIHVIYDGKNNKFYDNVDRSSAKRKNWGNNQSDGWLKLGRYSATVQHIYKKFYHNRQAFMDEYYQRLQFEAYLAFNDYNLNHQIK